MIKVDSVLISSSDWLRLEDVFVVNCTGFTIQGLNDDLLAVGLQEHICHVATVEEVNVVSLKECVVQKD